jgi:type IV secretory pathway VirB4 component
MLGRQKEAYVSSLISSKELTGCARGIQTSSLAACFPFVSDTHDDDKGLYVGESDDPAFIDFFRRDEMHVNSNVVVIGQSGSGKSYATKSILSGLASGGAKVYVLDPESEYGKLAQSLGGRRVDASGGANGIINPFQISMEMEGDDGTSSNAFYSQLQFIERFYRLTLSGISPDALELLNKLTVECYKAKGIGGDSDLRKLKPGDYPTFDDLCGLSDSRLSDSGDGYEKGCLLAIVNYLARFARGGRDSSLWDGPTSFSPKENFIAFDFQRLLANKNESTANAEMLLILRYIEGEVIANRERNAKEGTKRKVVVAIDEAHLFIDEKYPVALDFMYSLAKRIRKYDGMLMIITQNVRDFAGTPDIARKSSAIVSVSQYSMIFSLPPNDMNDLVGLYANSGGLSEEEKGLVSMSPRGTCFLISGPGERGFLSVIASKEAERKFEP